MYDRHNMTKTLRLIFSVCFILALSACSDDDSIATAETMTEIPQSVQAVAALITTDPDASLLAWITIDGGTRTQMAIDTVAGTSSASITGLSRSVHTVKLEFEFTDGVNTITLATVTSSVDLTNGDASLSFADTDYTITYDDDGDGINNVTEVKNGSDPLIPAVIIPAVIDCILDTSTIASINCFIR